MSLPTEKPKLEDFFNFETNDKTLLLDKNKKYQLTTGYSQNKSGLIYCGGISTEASTKFVDDGKELSRNFRQGYRVYSVKGISPTLTANGGGLSGKTALIQFDKDDIGNLAKIRRLGREEAEFLQGFPIGYTSCVSKSQALTMLGNGWNVPTIKHLLGTVRDKVQTKEMYK